MKASSDGVKEVNLRIQVGFGSTALIEVGKVA